MANINRDYLVINDVKKSNISLDNGSITFYITDKNTQNIFVNLVINISDNKLIQKYASIENAEDYTLTMHIVKPDNTYEIIQGKLHDKANAIFEFDLPDYCCDKVGSYRCELLTKCYINDREEITTSNKITYKVKSSVLNDLDEITGAPEYPLVIQLFDKLSDIEQYEEDRRANELARQLAEEQRQARFDELNADIDNKMVDVENRISAKEQAVDKLIVDTKADIDEYKTAKDQEIDDYKAAKDTEINEAIANQNTAINAQNDRITVIENNVVAQNSKLDVLETKTTTHEARITAVEAKDTEQDSRLDVAENRLANIGNDITNTMQPIIDEHTSRLEAIEAIDVAQNTRLDAIEAKNQQQDDRLLDIEKVNNRQDIDIKCLYGASQTIDVTKEGNSIYLQNSNNGFAIIDEIKGNTLVNCNKEPDKELILNGDINTSGDNTVTITEGVDGGLVDVALEGNTLVNVSKTKDSTAITKAYTVENSGNHIALQGDIDGSCRPVVTGNTLWIDNATEEVLTAFNETKNLRLQSTFEDNLVTQEMVDNGEEVVDNLGKYKVGYRVTGKNKFDINTLEEGTLNSNNGIEIENSSRCRSDYIHMPPGSYILTNSTSEWNSIIGFDRNYNYVKLLFDNKGTEYNFVITPDIYFIRVKFDYNMATAMADNIQIEEGDIATPYEPYKEYTKTLYLNSPLLEGDTIEEKDGGIYHVHRYKKFELGTISSWGLTTSEGEPYIVFYSSFAGSIMASGNVISATFPFREGTGEKINTSGTNFYVKILKSKLSTLDSDGFKQWLLENSVTVVYELATPTYELIEQSNLVIPSYANGHLDLTSAVPVDKVDFLPFSEELTYLYANTQYTLQFIAYKAITADITLGGTQLLAQSIIAGLNRITITTPATLTDNKLIISGVGANISEVVVTDTDREFTYFEGMKSVGECEGNKIEVSSDNSGNLFDKNDITLGVYLARVGGSARVHNNSCYCNKFIEVKENDIIYINDSPQITAIIVTYNENKKCIGTGYEGRGAYTIQKGVKYIRISFYNRNNLLDSGELWVGFSNDTIESKLYTFNKQEIPLAEPLRAVGNVKDRYVLIDGKWYIERKCEIRAYQEGDENNYKTDLINTVYPLEMSIYEEIDYNPLEVYLGTTNITTNSVIPTNITVKNHGFNCLLKPSTTYTISSNLGLNTVTTPSTLTEDCLKFMDTDTSDITTMKDVLVLEGDWTTKPHAIPANFSGIESAFEQEYDVEKGKYKVNVKVANEDKTEENNITFYINEPLRGVGNVKDRVFIKDDKVVVQRNCGVRPYEDGDFGTYLTDKVDTVYPLAAPTYEEVEYNDTKLLIESFKNSTLFYNSNVPVTSKVHYSYSVPLVNTVAQTANVTDQQDSMIIDLATQVAVMEMMLM